MTMAHRFSIGTLLLLAAVPLLPAQTPPSGQVPSGVRVLAIGKAVPGTTREKIMKILPEEVRATVRLYLQGKIQQWYSRQDGGGVIFVMDCKDVAEARSLLDELPLGRAKLLDFELIPISPLAPLRLLLGEAPGPAPSNP